MTEDIFKGAIHKHLPESWKNGEGHRGKKDNIKFYELSLNQEILIKVVELYEKR